MVPEKFKSLVEQIDKLSVIDLGIGQSFRRELSVSVAAQS